MCKTHRCKVEIVDFQHEFSDNSFVVAFVMMFKNIQYFFKRLFAHKMKHYKETVASTCLSKQILQLIVWISKCLFVPSSKLLIFFSMPKYLASRPKDSKSITFFSSKYIKIQWFPGDDAREPFTMYIPRFCFSRLLSLLNSSIAQTT